MADAISRSVAGMVGSLLLHGLLVALVGVYGSRLAARPVQKPPVDVWAGETFEVSAVDELAPLGAGVPAVPAPTMAEPRAGEARQGALPETAEPPAMAERAPGPTPPVDEYPADEGMGVDDALDPSVRERSGSESVAPAAGKRDERSAPSSDPLDDLAGRILAYAPKTASAGDAVRGATSASAAQTASAPAASVGAPAPVGAEGAPAPRNFARAFTRAIPAANTTDPVWQRLPVGSAGKLRLEIRIDAEGQVGDVDLGKDPPSHLERLVRRTLLALRGGRFELSGATRGEQRLELSVQISDGPVADGPLELGFHSPRPGRPGEAHFQLQSGRRVEITVTLLP